MADRVRGILERLLNRRAPAAGDGATDAELLGRFVRDRDAAAFELLVWRHRATVLGVCRRALRDDAAAEDAFQATFLVLARKAGTVRGNLGGWLFRVARRVAARAVARGLTQLPIPTDIPAPAEPDTLERGELAAVLDAEIARLPARLRGAVLLCYLGGHSTADAARELGCPRGTVLSRLAAARLKLAPRLARRGLVFPAALATVLTARLVSSAAGNASSFRAGTLAPAISTQLALGVLRTMTRTTLATVFGGLALAVTVGTGAAWVAARPAPAPVTAADAPKPADAPKAVDPPGPADVPKPAPAPDRARLDEQLKLHERYAEQLRSEIEAMERQIDLLAKASSSDAGGTRRVAQLQTRLDDTELEAARTQRKLAALEAEAKVVKRILEDKSQPAVDPASLLHSVARDEVVVKATLELDRARTALGVEVQTSGGANTPLVRECKDRVAKAEAALEQATKRATAAAVEQHREAARATLRTRLERTELEMLITSEQFERLKAEVSTLQKSVDKHTAGVVNIEAMRKSIAPQRETLDKLSAMIAKMRLQRAGIVLPETADADSKLDLVLRELAALRKEVRELKEKK